MSVCLGKWQLMVSGLAVCLACITLGLILRLLSNCGPSPLHSKAFSHWGSKQTQSAGEFLLLEAAFSQ